MYTVELRHGYTLDQVDHMAKAAVRLAGTYASDYTDRLDAAYGAIVIHLYETPHWPTRHTLIGAGVTAIHRLVESDLRTRGYRRANGYNGAGSAPRYAVYWWDHSTPTPSPEGVVVERVATGQVLARLTSTQMSAVTALAATGDHAAAAALLGVSQTTYADRLQRARRIILTLWHEGETPSRQRNDRRGIHRPRPTHCPTGHEYTDDNTYKTRGRSPRCKACLLAANRARRVRVNSPVADRRESSMSTTTGGGTCARDHGTPRQSGALRTTSVSAGLR